MTVRVYRSSDSGAPAIGRSLGSLITLLDAVLVNGYGVKAGLGWTKAYSDVNKAMYRQGAGSAGRYLYVDDSVNVDYANVRGVCFPASITDINRDAFGGTTAYFNKPDASWAVVGNEKFFYLFISRAGWGPYYQGVCFGDIASFAANDAGRTLLIHADYITGSALPAYDYLVRVDTSTLSNHSMAGGLQSTGALTGGLGKAVMAPAITMNYPAAVGGLLYAPLVIHHGTGGLSAGVELRGMLPGAYRPLHDVQKLPLASGTVIAGSGAYAGRSFEVFQGWDNTAPSVILIETSDTWNN